MMGETIQNIKTGNRLKELFESRRERISSIFFTAGIPGKNDTIRVLESLQAAGVDMVEVGIPFSDPIADGPVIQQSSLSAIRNGMNLPLLLEQVKEARATVSMPILLMGYLNPVYQYGIEKFLADCHNAGVDGLIIPDLPLEEYKESFAGTFKKHGLVNVFLVTPGTSTERIEMIDQASDGFIYLVSSNAITGAKKSLTDAQQEYFERIQKMQLKSPTMIGFGISGKDTFETACKYANGAIVGSAFVRMLMDSSNVENDIEEFVNELGIRK